MVFIRAWHADLPDDVQEQELTAGQVSIGRALDNDVLLDIPGASRYHARLELDQGQLWVVDLDSTNGTWIGGERVTRHPLGPGDRFQIGAMVFEVASASLTRPTVVEDWSPVQLAAARRPPGCASAANEEPAPRPGCRWSTSARASAMRPCARSRPAASPSAATRPTISASPTPTSPASTPGSSPVPTASCSRTSAAATGPGSTASACANTCWSMATALFSAASPSASAASPLPTTASAQPHPHPLSPDADTATTAVLPEVGAPLPRLRRAPRTGE